MLCAIVAVALQKSTQAHTRVAGLKKGKMRVLCGGESQREGTMRGVTSTKAKEKIRAFLLWVKIKIFTVENGGVNKMFFFFS